MLTINPGQHTRIVIPFRDTHYVVGIYPCAESLSYSVPLSRRALSSINAHLSSPAYLSSSSSSSCCFHLSIFLSLLSILSFAPAKPCRPRPILSVYLSSLTPPPFSAILQRISLSLSTPPTPDTRHPIPNYVKRFRILRPDYAASLPSLPLSLFLVLFYPLLVSLPCLLYAILFLFPRYRTRLPSKRIYSCKRSREIEENRRVSKLHFACSLLFPEFLFLCKSR